jgi:DNA-directed RNA polymerase specialized sigma24 family protein
MVVSISELLYTRPHPFSCGCAICLQPPCSSRLTDDHSTNSSIDGMQDESAARRAGTHAFSIEELAGHCLGETQRYMQHGVSHDTLSCYELFRRAVVDNDQAAYAHLCGCYAPLVARWVRKRLRFTHTSHDVDACVNWAFASMFRSLARPGAFAQFSALEPLLSYLRSCAFSAAETENRRVYAHEIELLEDLSTGADDVLDPILQAAEAEMVRRMVEALLKDDRERTVYESYFSLGLPPRAIFDMHPTLFRDVQDVHRVKQIMLERIGRSLHKSRQELGL